MVKQFQEYITKQLVQVIIQNYLKILPDLKLQKYF